MMNLIICMCAAFLHYVFRLTTFVEPLKIDVINTTKNDVILVDNTASNLPSTLAFLSICIILADVNLFSDRFTRRSTVTFKLFVELLAALIFIEIGMILIWSRLEQLITWIVCISICGGNLELYKDQGGDALTTMILMAFSIGVFLNACILTELVSKFPNRTNNDWTNWMHKSADVWHNIKRRTNTLRSSQGAKPLTMQGAGDGLETISKSSALLPDPEKNFSVRKKYLCLICEQRDC